MSTALPFPVASDKGNLARGRRPGLTPINLGPNDASPGPERGGATLRLEESQQGSRDPGKPCRMAIASQSE
jgi:hypothetical protein